MAVHKVNTRLDEGGGEGGEAALAIRRLRYGGARVFPQSHESLMTPGRSGPRNSRDENGIVGRSCSSQPTNYSRRVELVKSLACELVIVAEPPTFKFKCAPQVSYREQRPTEKPYRSPALPMDVCLTSISQRSVRLQC